MSPEPATARQDPAIPSGWRAAMAAGAFVALLAAVLWAYAPVLDNGLVWDDGANLVAARAQWDRGLAGTAWAWRMPFNGHYQPLTWLSYQLDAAVSGATPRGLHATNLLLHLLTTALVGWLSWMLASFAGGDGHSSAKDRARRLALAWVAAALFALHPVRVESVAWATERRDLLSAVFVLAALAVHLRGAPRDDSPSPVRGWVALLHALAALSRAQMSLPFVLLLLDLWPLRRLNRGPSRWRSLVRLVAEKAVSLAIAVASAVAAAWAQLGGGAMTGIDEHGLVARLVQAGYGLSFYPAALLGANRRLPLVERPYPFDPTAPALLGPALATVAVALALVVWRRRLPAVATAFGAYLLLVLPVLGLAQSGIQLVADRYAYLATVPLVLLVPFVAERVWRVTTRQAARWGLGVALLVLLGVGSIATRRQTAVWRSDETLWRHVLDGSRSCLADNNLGQLLFARGETGPALFHLVRSLEVAPPYGRPWRALVALLELPRTSAGAPPPEKVAAVLERAAAAQPGGVLPRYATALAWWRAGESAKAERALRQVLALEPGHSGARLALARLGTVRPEVSAPGARAPR